MCSCNLTLPPNWCWRIRIGQASAPHLADECGRDEVSLADEASGVAR